MLRGAIGMKFRLDRVVRGLPLLDAYPSLFGGRRPAFEEWLAHPEPSFWADANVAEAAGAMEVPVSLTLGWWDLSVN